MEDINSRLHASVHAFSLSRTVIITGTGLLCRL